jgi:flagellar biosynthesis protein FliR
MLVSVAQAQIFLLSLTRILAVLIHIPVLGGTTIPTQVRLGLGFLLTAVLIKWGPLPANTEALGLLPLTFAILKEMIIGTLAGFSANLTFAAIQIAGETMSNSAGFSAGRTLNPLMGDTGSSLEQLFVMMSMLIFLLINGHHTVLLALQRTFVMIPVNTPLPDFLTDRAFRMVSELIIAGIRMALPVMGTLLLADITLGLLSRVAPQVQVFFLGLPLKVGAGILVVGLTMTVIVPMVADRLNAIGERMLWLLGG